LPIIKVWINFGKVVLDRYLFDLCCIAVLYKWGRCQNIQLEPSQSKLQLIDMFWLTKPFILKKHTRTPWLLLPHLHSNGL
jgi:hypothetical protein